MNNKGCSFIFIILELFPELGTETKYNRRYFCCLYYLGNYKGFRRKKKNKTRVLGVQELGQGQIHISYYNITTRKRGLEEG